MKFEQLLATFFCKCAKCSPENLSNFVRNFWATSWETFLLEVSETSSRKFGQLLPESGDSFSPKVLGNFNLKVLATHPRRRNFFLGSFEQFPPKRFIIFQRKIVLFTHWKIVEFLAASLANWLLEAWATFQWKCEQFSPRNLRFFSGITIWMYEKLFYGSLSNFLLKVHTTSPWNFGQVLLETINKFLMKVCTIFSKSFQNFTTENRVSFSWKLLKYLAACLKDLFLED